MGIPKFFRWLSVRYPMCSQLIDDSTLPEFDALYLDCNGIIHRACKPDDAIPPPKLSDEQVFTFVFHYLDRLFQTIKPRKIFYIAIDGVAPRAKMNQQRSRRFRSAEDTLTALRSRTTDKDLNFIEGDNVFDGNAITPGTEFMAKLSVHIQYFLHEKITQDHAWRDVKVIFSGPDVPGEGEHKIMDYIRRLKASKDYDPTMRHCIYGLDADLIMLGLLTHERNTALLREEIIYGPKSKSKSSVGPRDALSSIEKQKFYLLHIGLLREYMKLEFAALDIDKVIDDFVLMCFLVGNDFLPHLPNLHINEGAIGMLFEAYKKGWRGYLHDSGCLNIETLEGFLGRLAKEFEWEVFDEQTADERWLSGKRRSDKPRDVRKRKKNKLRVFEETTLLDMMQSSDNGGITTEASHSEGTADDESAFPKAPKRKRGVANPEEQSEFDKWKAKYYKDKMDFDMFEEPQKVREMVKHYVEGIQWVLGYYYLGVQSWAWYYPSHYAPRISDMINISQYRVTRFPESEPFSPYQQLMGVLPPASRSLLPEAYRSLFTDELIEFYPRNFENDLNGKKQDWEAVVKIPFIDEKKLITEMRKKEHLLSAEERQRNGTGNHWTYELVAQPYVYKSSLPGVFSDISRCVVAQVPFNHPPSHAPFQASKRGRVAPGFPTLESLKFSANLSKELELVVFGQVAKEKKPTMTIMIEDQYIGIKVEDLAVRLLGSVVGIAWPRVETARVRYLKHEGAKYFKRGDQILRTPLTPQEADLGDQLRKRIESEYERYRGVVSGPVDTLVGVQKFVGWKKLDNQQVVGEYQDEVIEVALQTTLENVEQQAPKFGKLKEEFPLGERVFMLADKHYGCPAMIAGYSAETNGLSVKVRGLDSGDPTIAVARSVAESFGKIRWIPGFKVAEKLGIPSIVLSKVTSKMLVLVTERKKVEVGMNLKSEAKQTKTLGLTKKVDKGGWMYSPVALSLIREYCEKFKIVLQGMISKPESDRGALMSVSDFPGLDLDEVTDWLRANTEQYQRVSLDVEAWDSETIEMLDTKLAEVPQAQSTAYTVEDTPDREVLKPADAVYRLSHQIFNMGDRVRIITGNIGFASTATIVGVFGDGMVECVLDGTHFLAGSLNGRCKQYKGFRCHKNTLLNLSDRQLPYSTRMRNRDPRQHPHIRAPLAPIPQTKAWDKPLKVLKKPSKLVSGFSDPIVKSPPLSKPLHSSVFGKAPIKEADPYLEVHSGKQTSSEDAFTSLQTPNQSVASNVQMNNDLNSLLMAAQSNVTAEPPPTPPGPTGLQAQLDLFLASAGGAPSHSVPQAPPVPYQGIFRVPPQPLAEFSSPISYQQTNSASYSTGQNLGFVISQQATFNPYIGPTPTQTQSPLDAIPRTGADVQALVRSILNQGDHGSDMSTIDASEKARQARESEQAQMHSQTQNDLQAQLMKMQARADHSQQTVNGAPEGHGLPAASPDRMAIIPPTSGPSLNPTGSSNAQTKPTGEALSSLPLEIGDSPLSPSTQPTQRTPTSAGPDGERRRPRGKKLKSLSNSESNLMANGKDGSQSKRLDSGSGVNIKPVYNEPWFQAKNTKKSGKHSTKGPMSSVEVETTSNALASTQADGGAVADSSESIPTGGRLSKKAKREAKRKQKGEGKFQSQESLTTTEENDRLAVISPTNQSYLSTPADSSGKSTPNGFDLADQMKKALKI